MTDRRPSPSRRRVLRYAAWALPWTLMAAAGAVPADAPTAAPNAGAMPELRADQIVDKVVQARGGAEAWQKITSLVWVGHIESERLNNQIMRFSLEEQLPGKRRFDIISSQSSVRIFNGSKGWKLRSSNNGLPEVDAFSDLENRYELEAPDVGGPLISSRRQKRPITMLGRDTFEGHECYVLGIDLPSGNRQLVWVDSASFLELRLDRPSVSRDGKQGMVSVFYRNYNDQGGLQIPTLWEIGSASGGKRDRLVIERLAINPQISEARFAKPPSPPHSHEITITPPTPAGMPR